MAIDAQRRDDIEVDVGCSFTLPSRSGMPLIALACAGMLFTRKTRIARVVAVLCVLCYVAVLLIPES